jgi:hypothetical protein
MGKRDRKKVSVIQANTREVAQHLIKPLSLRVMRL